MNLGPISSTEIAVAWLGGVSAKVLLVLAAALVAGLLFRRARTRRAIWCTAICSALVIPCCSFFSPILQLGLFPATSFETSRNLLSDPLPQPDHTNRPALLQTATTDQNRQIISNRFADSIPSPPHQVPRTQPARDFHSWSHAVLGIWILGVTAVVVRFQIGLFRVWRLTQSGTVASKSEWQSFVSQMQIAPRVWRTPRLVWSKAVGTPLTWGFWRPVILIPAQGQTWSADRLHSILLHELSHIQRHDWVFQALTEFACAFHWFNPLIWRVRRHFQRDREFTCDADVIQHGIPASTYAGHLLEVAKLVTERNNPPNIGVAMARESQMKGRIMFILQSDHRRRRGTSVPILVVCLALGTVLLGLVGLDTKTGAEPIELVDTPVQHPAEEAAGFSGTVFTTPRWKSSNSNMLRIKNAVLYDPVELIGYQDGEFILRKSFLNESLLVFVHQAGDETFKPLEWAAENATKRQSTIELAAHFDTTKHSLTISINATGLRDYDWRIDGEPREFDEAAKQWMSQLLIVVSDYKQTIDLRVARQALRLEIDHLENQAKRLELRHQALVSELNVIASRLKRIDDAGHVGKLFDSGKTKREQLRMKKGDLLARIASVEAQQLELDADHRIELIAQQIAEFDSQTDLRRRDESLERKLRLFAQFCLRLPAD